MARKPRIHYPGATYHVMLRGNGGKAIFHADEDYFEFEKLVGEGVKRFQHRILAFCWMTNHEHLIIQVHEVPLSAIIQNLSFRYTRYFNKKLTQIGHLFQGRYKAILVDIDAYLLTLVLYIHLNPLRARLEKKLGSYRWSSHLAYIAMKEIPWLETKFVLSMFGKTLAIARERYLNYMLDEKNINSSILTKINKHDDRILRDDSFLENIYKKTNISLRLNHSAETITDLVCRDQGFSETRLLISSREPKHLLVRNMIAYLVIKFTDEKLSNIAYKLNVNASTLSRGRHEFTKQLDNNKSLRNIVTRIENTLNSN